MNIDQWQSDIEKHLFAETNNFKQARIFTGKASWNLSLANTTVESMTEVPDEFKQHLLDATEIINKLHNELHLIGAEEE